MSGVSSSGVRGRAARSGSVVRVLDSESNLPTLENNRTFTG